MVSVIPGAALCLARFVPPVARAARRVRVTLRSMLVLPASRYRPRLQVSVFQRQWRCTLASLLIVVLIETLAGACRANRCTEPSVRRSFSC
jgi:hypothetical protein